MLVAPSACPLLPASFLEAILINDAGFKRSRGVEYHICRNVVLFVVRSCEGGGRLARIHSSQTFLPVRKGGVASNRCFTHRGNAPPLSLMEALGRLLAHNGLRVGQGTCELARVLLQALRSSLSLLFTSF